MTLKEKITIRIDLLPLIPNPNQGQLNNYNLCIDKIEQLADEYAIEFANWFVLRYTEAVFYRENYTVDLLQEFKKEKEL